MVDIELTDVEIRSQRSQPSIQSASVKEPSSDENESQSQSSLPPCDPDASGKHPESSVPAHNVEATLEDKDEDLIMLPAAKLEEWLKHGIRILRESRQRTKAAGSDPEYEALENESENTGPPKVETSSARGRSSGSRFDGQLPQQSIDEFLLQLGDLQLFTATQRKFVDPFFDRVRRNPFYSKEISADSPLKDTIDRDVLSNLQLGEFDRFLQFTRRFNFFKNHELSLDLLWQNYFGELLEPHHSRSVAHDQWSVAVRKAWFRRRLNATMPSRDSILVGICYAHMLCNGGTHGGNLTIGSVLSYCFDSEVLSRGEVSDYEGIMLLAKSIPIFNDYMRLEPDFLRFQPRSDDLVSLNRRLLLWLMSIKIEEALALNLPEFMLIIRFLKVQSTLPINRIDSPSPTSLFINDLNFESLKNIGGLRLVWTDVLEEHLLLDPGTRRLFVTFFGSLEESTGSFKNSRKLSQYRFAEAPIWNAFDPTNDSETNRLRIIGGVHKTWDLLNSASEDRRKLYRSIVGMHGWPTERLWKNTGTITSSECRFLDVYHDTPSYQIQFAVQNKSELPYTHFGPLENRVRTLREYMDKQKPRGFRQLWMDSRDSFNYYTFWGVIIFGAVSVFLATASLAVSIAQTYASFKSLG
ncbi:hypothetical protein EAF00_006381 [Botryotinia globosa]|nr:hypothetical protein EAF00_006381 [Botryotinia globosa]